MLLRTIACLLSALSASPGSAHPGHGIGVTDDGSVIVADVGREMVWRIEPGGKARPLVRSSWTHDVQIAADGTIYYEREEPVDGVAPCSLWRITPDGEREQVIPPQRDRRAFGGEPFVIDDRGRVYYAHSERDAQGEWRARIMRRSPSGEVVVLTGRGDGALFTDGDAGTATIRIVTAMALGPGGLLYFADRDHIRTVVLDGPETGAVGTVASGIIEDRPSNPPQRRGPPTTINRIYGIAVGKSGELYAAYQAGRRVIRIGADGERTAVHRSEAGWSPIGVAVRDGSLYVLDVADRSIEQLRVTLVTEAGASRKIAELGAD